MSQVAKAKPGGYTVLMALASIVVLPEADIVLQRKPMFALKQLEPVARFTADPVVLVVQADSPWKDFKQFAAVLRQKPGGYTFGSSGSYGTPPQSGRRFRPRSRPKRRARSRSRCRPSGQRARSWH